MSDRIGVMFKGRLVQVDSPSVLYAQPCNRDVAAFIGGMNFLPATVTDETGDRLGVEAAGFGKMTIAANPNVRAHDRELLVGIRPEQLEIKTTEPEGYDATVQGTVTDVAFYGETVHYYVKIDGADDPLAVVGPQLFPHGRSPARRCGLAGGAERIGHRPRQTRIKQGGRHET